AVTAPSVHNPAIPAELDQVVIHSLAKDRADRFQTAEDFRDHLRAAAANLKSEPAPTQAAEVIGDDFNALLAGAKQATPAPTAPVSGSKSFLDSAESKPAVSEATTQIKTAPATEAINPFESIGVEFPAFTAEQPILTREIQKRKGLLWGVGSGVLVVLIGLMVWGLFQKGFNFQVDPNAGIAVSDVVGQPFDTANATLTGQKLLINKLYQISDTVPAESVIRTDPVAGTKVPENTTVTVYVSSGKDQVAVPSLEGMTEADASAAIQAAGFTLGTITTANSATIKAGSVISSDPTTGNLLAKGSPINLIVSNGKVLVPDVTNLDITDAQNQLTSPSVMLTFTTTTAGACVGTPGTVVLSQSVAPGSTVAPGTNVVLIVACQP
ncbi:MAG: PASTA domain-containing protein, partial [Actinomycetes bacterium]